MSRSALGIYLHIPFCIKKCNYCDFCSFPNADGSLIEAYVDELVRRIKCFSEEYGKRQADTVYFGGGTPTLMPTESFKKIFSALEDSFDITPDAEITVECNPARIDRKGLLALRALGANRLSIGLQSVHDDELSALGRVHSFEDFRNTFFDARAAGFGNISADLMYGIPLQTLESFERTLSALVDLRPEHISAYGLKIEEGTAFYRDIDKLVLPDEDGEVELYSLCCDLLQEAGYDRYEISNFALSKKESRHNLKYWNREDYIGFGVAAHSCFEGERFGNSRDMRSFLDGKDICDQRERISENDVIAEYVMLGLRLARGIDLKEFAALSKKDFKAFYPAVDGYIKNGFMIERDGKIAFTTKGFLVSNAILSEILSFEN